MSVEEVAWGFPAYEEEESAELFIQMVYEAYLREVGEYFGDPICGFFSDADNRRVNYRVFAEDSPQRNYFPWSNSFPKSFEKKYGYDIRPYLPVILRKESCPQAVDYWEHAGWLYQGWFRANYKWCREHGLEYTFHTSDSSPFPWEEAPRCSVFTEGRALDMENNCDYPGTDQELLEINGGKHMRQEEMWTPRISWAGDNAFVKNPEYYKVYGDLRAKQAGSCAFLNRKKGAMCEMFAASNWGATFTQLREIAAWQIMQGVTFIVPHAYHYRFGGQNKYFAPPFYAKGSTLNYGAKQLNDTLSTYCYYTSQGRLKAPIAVLDITDGLWERRTIESNTLFTVCEQLNRMPYGYVFADVKSILANKDEFQVIINTGAPLSEKMKQALAPAGLPILEVGEWNLLSAQAGVSLIERLTQYLKERIECTVFYQGEGTPHFMRRRLDDGSELVILANIEDGQTIKGTLQIGTSAFEVILHAGELIFYTEKGMISVDQTVELFSALEMGSSYSLPEEVPVIWEQENIIPIEFWKDEHGSATSKCSDARLRTFNFIVAESGVPSLKLLISKRHAENICSLNFDGQMLPEGEETVVFDDPYLCYVLEATEGEHCITLKTQGRLTGNDRIILQGEFGVEVDYEEPYAVCFLSQYCQDNYIPAKASVTLRKRPSVLQTTDSWTEQGHIFYSGKATYCFSLQLAEDWGEATLYLPQVSTACEVTLDGKAMGQRIFTPYAFSLGNVGGSHQLKITVCNTMANSMEGYKAPSGITAGVFLIPG